MKKFKAEWLNVSHRIIVAQLEFSKHTGEKFKIMTRAAHLIRAYSKGRSVWTFESYRNAIDDIRPLMKAVVEATFIMRKHSNAEEFVKWEMWLTDNIADCIEGHSYEVATSIYDEVHTKALERI